MSGNVHCNPSAKTGLRVVGVSVSKRKKEGSSVSRSHLSIRQVPMLSRTSVDTRHGQGINPAHETSPWFLVGNERMRALYIPLKGLYRIPIYTL